MAPPYAYETWTFDHYDFWQALNAVPSGESDDADQDGRNNLYEYAFAGNPTDALDRGDSSTFTHNGNQFELRSLQRNNNTSLVYRVEICTNLMSGVWTDAGLVAGTNGTVGDFSDVGYILPVTGSDVFVRLKSELPQKISNDGWFELISPGGTDNHALIQGVVNNLHPGATLKLFGSFIIKRTLYLPSNFKWILDGSLTLGTNPTLDSVGWTGTVYGVTINARKRTAITEKAGGAGNIHMSGGTYNGNDVSASGSSVRFINFVWATNCYFNNMVISNASDDNFTLGPGCNNNVCRQLISSASVTGNGLTDKGDHNKWFDCIAQDCRHPDGDGWTPKCRFSEFYRCIARRNNGPGYGMYCRMDGSPTNNNIGEAIDGNRFYACESYENDGGAGFSFNISDNNGIGATIRSNYVEAICYSNQMSGLYFRNKLTNGIVAANEINLFCWGNRGLNADGVPTSTGGGMVTDGGTGYLISGITGSIVAFDNLHTNNNYDVNIQHANSSTITVYRVVSENATRINSGSSTKSNRVTTVNVSSLSNSHPWCVHAYFSATNLP